MKYNNLLSVTFDLTSFRMFGFQVFSITTTGRNKSYMLIVSKALENTDMPFSGDQKT
jgi:hypothetical protein